VNEEPREVPQEKKKPIRRRYAVDRLPPSVQAEIFRGYGRGDAYWKIREKVKSLGHNLSENALSRYWRNVWGHQVERIRLARQYKEALKEAMLEAPESENAKLAEELLYSMVMLMLDKVEQEKPLDILREAREQKKAGGKADSKRPPGEPQNPTEQARVIRRRWRELYGLDEPNEEEGKKPEEE